MDSPSSIPQPSAFAKPIGFTAFNSGEVVDRREISNGMVEWNERRSVAETPKNSTVLILAAKRTHRRCPINGFKYYNDGWNLKNMHYLFVTHSDFKKEKDKVMFKKKEGVPEGLYM